ncbi:MAG: cytochrome c oxidase accessory protein CcoG [Verrucomicrobiota bacterium]
MATPSRKNPSLEQVTTINEDGSRYFLHPSDVQGVFTRFRRWFGYLLIAIYIALPWIPINGYPAVFIDLLNRRFHFFGITLIPQDLWVLFFGITGLGFFLFFLTALLGRLWCGWACPYTVFLEHIYRRVERWIDGDAPHRRQLDAAPWGGSKIAKRLLKYALYFLVSTLLAHVFLAYFISIPELWNYMAMGPFAHPFSFGVVAFFTATFFFCFAWFREQFCIIMCPYGRLQSVLTDEQSVVIGYDEKRGEPRGKGRDREGLGDCIDCHRCVQVCPTGIDIRNGLQLECIGCAACIDACNKVMENLELPKGLVRYDSEAGLERKKRKWLRPRIFVYGILGLIGLAAFTTVAFFKASPYYVNVFRSRGVAPFVADAESVRNQFEFLVINKRNQPVNFEVVLSEAPPGATLVGETERQLDPLGEETFQLKVVVPSNQYAGPSELKFAFESDLPGKLREMKESFSGPNVHYLKRLIEDG